MVACEWPAQKIEPLRVRYRTSRDKTLCNTFATYRSPCVEYELDQQRSPRHVSCYAVVTGQASTTTETNWTELKSRCSSVTSAGESVGFTNTPFTRWSWLEEPALVSWTSQLDVYSTFPRRLLDACSMFAWSCKQGISEQTDSQFTSVQSISVAVYTRLYPKSWEINPLLSAQYL